MFLSLKENQLLPLLTTLSEKGPAVVSVDAEAWTIYDGGIFNGCQKDPGPKYEVKAASGLVRRSLITRRTPPSTTQSC